jgi:hypothetical protein
LRFVRALYRSFVEENTADARARRLLREWLNPEQLAQRDEKKSIEVTGSHSGRRYRIHEGLASNVIELDEKGFPTTGWCFVPSLPLPVGDVMLAQKIALEADEMAALAVARRFPPSLPRT